MRHVRTVIIAVATLALGLSLVGITTWVRDSVWAQPAPLVVQPCDSDDGSGPTPCFWDGTHRGNGKGSSFIWWGDGTYTTVVIKP